MERYYPYIGEGIEEVCGKLYERVGNPHNSIFTHINGVTIIMFKDDK